MSVALNFVAPPPGFAPHREFALTPVEGSEGLFTMRAVDDADLRLYVVDPNTVLQDYAPTLSDEQTAQLSLESPDDAMLLVVAHPAAEGVSVNLLAPVVINRGTGVASQVILEGQDFPLRAPLG